MFVAPGGDDSIQLAIDGELWPTDKLIVASAPSANGDQLRTLWKRGKLKAIGVGYVLDEDNVWWPHEWGWDFADNLLDPVTQYRKYIGVLLEGDAMVSFFDPSSS